jgi:enolase-phosphatase E1
MKPAVILLDIEGTTTPISFVYDVLFPYARKHMRNFLEAHIDDSTKADTGLLAKENAADRMAGEDAPAFDPASQSEVKAQAAGDYLLWLMDRDRKSPALKMVQGNLWEAGYASGELHSIVFPDVPDALARWKNEGLRVAIYSSGSVLAQKLIFGHTQAGDLRAWLESYFDTGVGAKTQASSYSRIAQQLGVAPDQILFVSDALAELSAAHDAGCQVRLAVRPGNKAVNPEAQFERIETFTAL